jgi:hypothetical protein
MKDSIVSVRFGELCICQISQTIYIIYQRRFSRCSILSAKFDRQPVLCKGLTDTRHHLSAADLADAPYCLPNLTDNLYYAKIRQIFGIIYSGRFSRCFILSARFDRQPVLCKDPTDAHYSLLVADSSDAPYCLPSSIINLYWVYPWDFARSIR